MQKYLLIFFFILSAHVAVAQGPLSFIDSVQPSCNGMCDGYARVKITGGTPPYSIIWNSTPVQSATVATNLCPGRYSVVILDSNNLSTISNVTIPSDVVHVAVTHTNLSCSNYGIDTATVAATSLLSPISYVWNNGTATYIPTITNLPVGANTVTATDGYGCITTDTFTVHQPTEIRFGNAVNNALCYDSSSGTITATIIGGTAPYRYLWDNDTSQHTNIRSNAAAGRHVLVLTDSTNCIVTDTATVGQPTPGTVSNVIMNAQCYGYSNGVIAAIGAGGTPPYTYSWNTTPIQTSMVAKLLPAGTYIVTLTDSNSCILKDTVTLTQPSQLMDSTSKTDLICYGLHNGRGSIFPYGSVPPYHIAWANHAFTGNIDTALSAGANAVTVQDANGCFIADTIRISQPPAIIVSITNTPDTGHCTGTATAVILSGGVSPYSYLWSTGATTSAITGLCGNKYTLQVTDSTGCTNTDSTSIKTVTGVAAVNQAGITIAPNPFVDYVVVNWSKAATQPVRICITNITGATLSSLPVDDKTTTQKISTATWVPGLYFVSIIDENGEVIMWNKVVKE